VTTALVAMLGGMLSNHFGYAPVCLCGSLLQGVGLVVAALTGIFS
jgi:predicted MFS family arabinose efflux permease